MYTNYIRQIIMKKVYVHINMCVFGKFNFLYF